MSPMRDLSSRLATAIKACGPALQTLGLLTARHDRFWIVGGALRNALADEPLCDLDIATGEDPAADAAEISGELGATLVPLDRERGVYRLAFREPPGFTIDITRLNGQNIEQDLARRDFTINAIAAQWRDDDATLLDPLGGVEDMRSGVLRPVSPRSFIDDPVRVLRSYRFISAYGLSMTVETRGLIRESAPLLTGVAGERKFHELRQILAAPETYPVIASMDEDGVLDELFPELGPSRGVTQNSWHHLDVFDHTIETMRTLDHYVKNPPGHETAWESDTLITLRLAALYHDAGKPEARTVKENGEAAFIGHETIGERMVTAAARRLCAPNAVVSGAALMVRHHLRPFNALADGQISRRAMYRYLRDLGRWAGPALALALADADATRGPKVAAERRETERGAVESIVRFRDELESAAKARPPLINGHDIMKMFGLPPGPMIGDLLDKAREAEALGEVKGKEEVLGFITGLLKNNAG